MYSDGFEDLVGLPDKLYPAVGAPQASDQLSLHLPENTDSFKLVECISMHACVNQNEDRLTNMNSKPVRSNPHEEKFLPI